MRSGLTLRFLLQFVKQDLSHKFYWEHADLEDTIVKIFQSSLAPCAAIAAK